MALPSTTRRDDRAVRAKRHEAMNQLLRRGRVEQEQERDDSGRFTTGLGMDGGSRGGESTGGGDWLRKQLTGDDS
jgi:hypothetical protein